MKQNLLKPAVVVAVTVGIVASVVVAAVAGFTAGETRASASAGRGRWSCDETMLEYLPSTLNITVDQLDNVRRITDRAQPQLATVRNDAREKRQAIMDTTISEIAVLLTPKQHEKLDELQKAHQEERRAKKKFREALKPRSLFESQ
jgi:Spy/CpxP family protein refolding chaperone